MTREEMLKSMIADYQRKIDTYQTMIAEWEKEIGVSGPRTPSSNGSVSPAITNKNAGAEGDVLGIVRDYQFFGKSQPEAAKLFLEMVGYPLKTGVILAGLEKGGIKIGGKTEKDKKQNFYTILNRSSELGRVARDTWGIVGWPGVPKKQPGDEAKDEAEDDEKEEAQASSTTA